MRARGQIRIVRLMLLLAALVMAPFASAQTSYSASTETHDSTWNRSTRVKKTRAVADGHTIDTRIVEVPSVNRGYRLDSATEREIVEDGMNITRIVERSYGADADGNRHLYSVSEEQRTTTPGGGRMTVRTRYDSDWDQHLRAMERDVEESTPLDGSSQQIVRTVYLLRGSILVPVQKTVTVETRDESGAVDVQHTISFVDQNGRFLPAQVVNVSEDRSVDAKTQVTNVVAADLTKVLGEGEMFPIQRTVARQWTSLDGQEHRVVDTYSLYTTGVSADGRLHIEQQVATHWRVLADGSTQELEETAQVKPGARTGQPDVIERRTTIFHGGAVGQFETKNVVEAPDSSGAMQPYWSSVTRGFRAAGD